VVYYNTVTCFENDVKKITFKIAEERISGNFILFSFTITAYGLLYINHRDLM
jgi:hypothetical protein